MESEAPTLRNSNLLPVNAKGDVSVEGVVEAANIYAGGQIILKRGVQGGSKGYLEAGTNVIAKFIESATVKCGGYLTNNRFLIFIKKYVIILL